MRLKTILIAALFVLCSAGTSSADTFGVRGGFLNETSTLESDPGVIGSIRRGHTAHFGVFWEKPFEGLISLRTELGYFRLHTVLSTSPDHWPITLDHETYELIPLVRFRFDRTEKQWFIGIGPRISGNTRGSYGHLPNTMTYGLEAALGTEKGKLRLEIRYGKDLVPVYEKYGTALHREFLRLALSLEV